MGKTPSSRRSKITRTVTNTCHERAYFDTALRAFLKDAGMSDDTASTASAPEMGVNSVNSEECAAPTRIFREAYSSISEKSLAMPSHVQAQTIREICACLNTGLDGRSLPSWQSGVPFSSNVQHVLLYKFSPKISDQSPLRRMIQDFAVAFQSRVVSHNNHTKLRTSDADYGYLLLRLSKYKVMLDHYSRAYRTTIAAVLPIELQTIISEVLETLPILPAGKDALRLSKVQGLVLVVRLPASSFTNLIEHKPSTFACCLPRLAGPSRVQAIRKIGIPVSAKQALEHFGKPTSLEAIYKQTVGRLRRSYPLYAEHDTLHALAIFTCLLVCHEYYMLGMQNHILALRQFGEESKRWHVSLMQGTSSYTPMSQCSNSQQTSTGECAISLPSLDADTNSVQPGSVDQATVRHGIVQIDNEQSGRDSWLAPVIPPFSSKTFSGPFGRSEQQVLERLAELDKSGKLERGDSTIGKSFYRSALDLHQVVRAPDSHEVAMRPVVVQRSISADEIFESCFASLDELGTPAAVAKQIKLDERALTRSALACGEA